MVQYCNILSLFSLLIKFLFLIILLEILLPPCNNVSQPDCNWCKLHVHVQCIHYHGINKIQTFRLNFPSRAVDTEFHLSLIKCSVSISLQFKSKGIQNVLSCYSDPAKCEKKVSIDKFVGVNI